MQQQLVGQGLLIFEVLRSHSDTPQSVGILCRTDRPDADASTWQNTTERDIHGLAVFEPNFQQASDCRSTPWTARPLGSAVRVIRLLNIS
jgi:hypothetical protein